MRKSNLETIRIQDLASGGDGFGYFRGSPAFVSLTAPGDLVVPGEVRRSRGVLFASPAAILEKSAMRREPPCPYYGECGGCSWMHMPYSVQLEYKQKILTQVLARIGRVKAGKVEATAPAPAEFKWRHRIRAHHSGGKLGFFKRHSRELVQWKRCLIAPDLINDAVALLRDVLKDRPESMARLKWVEAALSPVDSGLSLAWFLKQGFQGAPVRDTVSRCGEAFSAAGLGLSTQSVFINGQDAPFFSEGAPLKLRSAGSGLLASPGTFFQVNPGQNDHLAHRVLSTLKNRSVESLADLYCGNGNFSFPCAGSGMSVTGIESGAGAINDARRTSHGSNPHFIESRVEGYVNSMDTGKFDAVLVDPPRAGLSRQVREWIIASGTATLVYISCDPATLARDISSLIEKSYRVVSVEPVDMFPQSHHLESIALLEING